MKTLVVFLILGKMMLLDLMEWRGLNWQWMDSYTIKLRNIYKRHSVLSLIKCHLSFLEVPIFQDQIHPAGRLEISDLGGPIFDKSRIQKVLIIIGIFAAHHSKEPVL